MEYIEYLTTHGKLGGLSDGIPLIREDGTLMVSLVGALVGSSKGSKYFNFDGVIDVKVKMSFIWVLYVYPLKDLEMARL